MSQALMMESAVEIDGIELHQLPVRSAPRADRRRKFRHLRRRHGDKGFHAGRRVKTGKRPCLLETVAVAADYYDEEEL